jgi:aryl-alcohol dehydrogenase-like predicted oxidoreductase
MRFKEAIQPYLFNHNGNPIRYGIGCAWLGQGSDYRSRLDQDLLTFQTAYQLGFRYYDTAPHYSNSEFVVGEFVASIPRESIFLATKFNLKPELALTEACDHTRSSLEESLRRLKTDHLDLFQIHDVDRLDQVLPEGGVLEVLRDAKRQGLIRFFGLATRWHNLLETAARHGEFDTILTYQDYTPFRQSAAQVIRLASERGVGVINGSPLGGMRENKLDLKDRELVGESLRFPLSNSQIDITLTGPGKIEELRSSVEALTKPSP